MLAAPAAEALAPEFRGVVRGRFLLGSDILTSLSTVNFRIVVDLALCSFYRCCHDSQVASSFWCMRHESSQGILSITEATRQLFFAAGESTGFEELKATKILWLALNYPTFQLK